jgi:hypothetical protein
MLNALEMESQRRDLSQDETKKGMEVDANLRRVE